MTTQAVRSLGLLLVLSGVALLPPLPGASGQERKSDPAIGASPSSLFPKDLARLEPHLGMETGCVGLAPRFTGTASVRLTLERWQQGKVTEIGRLDTKVSSLLAHSVSISVREVERRGKSQYRITVVHSVSSDARAWGTREVGLWFLDPPAFEPKATGRKQLPEEVSITASGAVPVWALLYSSSGDIKGGKKTVAESAKEAEWAIVFKVGFGKK
jgi:hypothetical protein